MQLDEVVQLAMEEARRRGHRQVLPEHLLLASFKDPTVVVRLAGKHRSLARTVEAAEASLTARAATSGYRDTEVAMSSAATAVLAAAKPGGIWGALRARTPVHLFDALDRSEPFRSWWDDVSFDPAPIHALYEDAVKEAMSRSHRNVLLEHALLAWTQVPRFRSALEVAGANPDVVRASLLRLVTGEYRSRKLASADQLVHPASVRANMARRRDLAVEHVVVEVLRIPEVKQALAAVNVDGFELLFAYVHGVTTKPDDAVTGVVDVLFHNDDLTTMEAVVAVLMEAFDCDLDGALKRMREVDRGEAAVVFTGDATDVKLRVEKARTFCRNLLMPLRMTVAPRSTTVVPP